MPLVQDHRPQCAGRPKKLILVWSREKIHFMAMQGDGWLVFQKYPNSWKENCEAFLKARLGRGGVWLLQILAAERLCYCSCSQRSGRDVPINLQQDTERSKAEDMGKGPAWEGPTCPAPFPLIFLNLYFYYYFFFFGFVAFRATPAAHGGSQAEDPT